MKLCFWGQELNSPHSCSYRNVGKKPQNTPCLIQAIVNLDNFESDLVILTYSILIQYRPIIMLGSSFYQCWRLNGGNSLLRCITWSHFTAALWDTSELIVWYCFNNSELSFLYTSLSRRRQLGTVNFFLFFFDRDPWLKMLNTSITFHLCFRLMRERSHSYMT